MTEEIIIDGVNVAGCGYFCEADNECSICGMGTDGEDTFCKNCKDNSNCYYKQFKQAENTVNECHKYLAELEDKIDRLEQENKELKSLNKKICEDWEKEIKVYWNALEEIRKIASPHCSQCVEILNKINEVLSDDRN